MRRPAPGTASTVVAVAGSVLVSLYAFGAEGRVPGDKENHLTLFTGLSLLVAIGAAVMLCWRHRRPALVTGITIMPPLLLAADPVAALIALAALVASRRDRMMWAGVAAVYAATALAIWRDARRAADANVVGQFVGTQPTVGHAVGVLVMAAVLTAIPLWVGLRRRARAELARRERKEHELRAEMARQDERSRIAREMHDVLGHRLSLLSLQAGALEVSRDEGSQSAAEAARTVRTTARQSLEDLRQVIGVLEGGVVTGRDLDGRHPAEHPQPTLTDLPELIANARRAGLLVNLTILLNQAASAPAPLGIVTYRVIQESLTNVLRHAPGTVAEVTVTGGPGVGIAVEVVNPIPVEAPGEPRLGSGTGLTGISARVALLGGNVSAEPTDEGVFALRAWLPWAEL